jgi:KDO2-lipid IV(A) lauroyltransferase
MHPQRNKRPMKIKTKLMKNDRRENWLKWGFNFLSLFSLAGLHRTGKLIGTITYLFPSRMKFVIQTNLSICYPYLTQEQKNDLTFRIIQQTFIVGAEMPYLFMKDIKHCINKLTVKGAEEVNASLSNGRGALVVGPHIGSWEMALLYLGQNFPVHVLYTPPKKPSLDSIIYQTRSRSGATMEPATPQGVKNLFRALKQGKMVVLLTDQVPTSQTGANFIPFYGKLAKTMNMPLKLYRSLKPDVYCFHCLRTSDHQYALTFERFNEQLKFHFETSLSPDPFAEACHQYYESLIDQYPEQYQWGYKRFKHQPKGFPNPYKY